MVLAITKQALDEIMTHAEQAYPEECCGLLIAGSDRNVATAIPMKNSFPGPKNERYHIEPLELYKVDRSVAQDGRYIAGIYHSHPDSPASLSGYDLEHSFPWYCYLVVSVPKGKAGDYRAWIPKEDRSGVSEESVHVASGGGRV